jgi:hypothetical protein
MEFAKKNGIRIGLIFGIIAVVYSFGAYAIDETLFTKWWLSLLLFVGSLFFFIYAMVQTRKQLGGYITFREAFSAFMIAAIVYLLMSTAANMLLFQVIDTGLADRVKERMIEASLEWFEKMNMPEEAIDEAITKMEEQDQFSIGAQLKSVGMAIVFFAVIAAISAAIVKRNKPEWEAVDKTEE